jgi:hypothetical protein
MASYQTIDPILISALAGIADFIQQVTGAEPTQAELADALSRYFVLNEIKEHILMMRENTEWS